MPFPHNRFPILAIAGLTTIAAALFLLVYFTFLSKCRRQSNPHLRLRRFSFRHSRPRPGNNPLLALSPSWQNRGLDEFLIRKIPSFPYSNRKPTFSDCGVCLSEFRQQDTIRVLPSCSHEFHLDCIDVWLQSNPNCPLCRTSISGDKTRCPIDQIIAPSSSPQEDLDTQLGSDDDYVVIELSGQDHSTARRNIEKDDEFSVQPLRRSFSLDSATDRRVYLSVQETTRKVRWSEENSNRVSRSLFSFGNGRGSRSSVLPIEF